MIKVTEMTITSSTSKVVLTTDDKEMTLVKEGAKVTLTFEEVVMFGQAAAVLLNQGKRKAHETTAQEPPSEPEPTP